MSLKTALKPCPFCGGEADIDAWPAIDAYNVYCERCLVKAPDYATKEEAITAWNQRVGDKEADDDTPELKPCPFCGGKAELYTLRDIPPYTVYCKRCAAQTTEYKGKYDAIAAWNRRVVQKDIND